MRLVRRWIDFRFLKIEWERISMANKIMFGVGILLIIVVAVMFLFVEEDIGISPIVLGIIGIVIIGASKYRPLKTQKKEKKK